MKFAALSMLVFAPTFALASLAPPVETPPGEVQTSFVSPRRGITEFCSLPRILDAGASASTGEMNYLPFLDSEKNSTKKICSADFYDNRETTEEVKAVVLCPKLNSTNPGLMFHELPLGTTRATFLAKECPKEGDRSGDTIAKFKQSVSCSNTSSILGYPRMARSLRSQIEFPFTAYRSMDLSEHFEAAANARAILKRQGRETQLIGQTWKNLYDYDTNPKAHRGTLYKAEDSLIFGALVPNAKGEIFYSAANGSTVGDRVAKFQLTAAFAAVTSPRPVGSGVPFSAASAQKMILLREMGDMIVLDTLMSQQDRFGNLQYRWHYVKMEADGSLTWKVAAKKKKKDLTPAEVKLLASSKSAFVRDPKQAVELESEGYVYIKRMLLDDNDCGVSKENRMAAAGIAQKVTHLHPDTYLGVQNLQKLAAKGLLTKYLKEELLFRDVDAAKALKHLATMATVFKKKCLEGRLFLDADLAQYTGTKSAVNSVEFCKSN